MADPAPKDDPDQDQPAPGLSISQRALAARAPAQNTGPTPSYLEGLNTEQRAAVESTEGPVLVLAGAGTGKTRVLTTRIGHILATQKAWPSQILAVTFTNKAAREMKHRIGTMIGDQVEGMPWLGTFHSIGVRMLRRHAELVDLKSGFTILDPDDVLRLLKQLMEAENVDPKRWPARTLSTLIDSWKNRGIRPQNVPQGEAFAFANGKGGTLYTAYQNRLKELNACDFGDLLLECLRLFQENPDVLAQYHQRFKYMLVDEYQDTNVAQYLWLRLLAQRPDDQPQNICCVGDDDQSIYGWRGAEVDNILRFDKDFPGATVVRLEQNYRSTGHILAAASHVITHNEGRLGKTLHTEDEDGEKVVVQSVWDDEEEARVIADDIEQLQRRPANLNEVAILVRASFQMRAIEDRFVTTGIPYRVIGGPRFYERAEIKDAVAYFEAMANPSNDLKFERIINTPKRGVGAASVQKMHAHARQHSIPLTQAAMEMTQTNDLPAKARNSVLALVGMLDHWRSQIDEMPHTELAEMVLDESGYTAMWQKDKSPQAHSRLENLKELIRFMGQFGSMAEFLEHVSLVMDAEQNEDGERVSLMTLHAAKGLEFDHVFLPGWEEGLFPHQRALDESGKAGLEEERRLAYVGITRAKREAKIMFAQNRRIHALWQAALPSRFIDELPPAHVTVAEVESNYGGYMQSRFDKTKTDFGSTYDTPGWKRAQKNWNTKTGTKKKGPKTIEGELIASSVNAPSSDYTVGERVFHQKFGYGAIASIDGNKLMIDFEKAGQKRVVDSFVERH